MHTEIEHERLRSSSSSFRSISGLRFPLDVNPLQQRKSQIMEDMDIDQVVDVPDTPDRLAARHGIGKESVAKVCNSALACHLSNPHLVDEKSVNGLRLRGKFFSENGHSRRLVIHPPKNLSNLEVKSCSNSSVPSSGSSSQNAHFRRAAVGKSSSREAKHSTGTEHMDKGKSMSIKISPKSSACQENTKVFDLTKQNGHTQLPKMIFPHGELEDFVAEDTRQGRTVSGGSSIDCMPNHLERSKNAIKGKEKVDDNMFKGLGKWVDLSTDPQGKAEQQKSMPLHSSTLPRVSGQKRLVRNGCISPHNIATRAKQLAEQPNNSSKNIQQSHSRDVGSNGSPYVIDISEDNNSFERVKEKGKGVIAHSSTPKENNARFIHTSSSSLVNDNKEANGTSNVGRDMSGCSEGLSGWRSTRNRSRKMDHSLSDSTEHIPSRINGVGNFANQHENIVERRDTGSEENQRTEDDFVEDLNATLTASGLVSNLDRIAGPQHAAKTVIKRQRKRGLSLRNHGECSTSVSGDSDIVFLGSSEASENSKSSRIQRRQVIEVDELSPAAGHSAPHGFDSMNDDSDARARQLEADEILARELQEQLYHEAPIIGGGEIDEHIAWALHQEDNYLNTSSSGSRNISHRGGSTILHQHRQPRPESFQNPSTRRGTQARVPTSSRMAQLRSRFRSQSPRVSTRGRNLRFPMGMDLDMRINILEALEAAVEDLSDVGLDNPMLRVQRDFNDNDYEMLLALDENNHRHAGATAHQINALPQSTVQTDASEEACVICLETPTIGETVRHLPCLHRFHKECIDPWLSRRTSCPVCKCSIT